MPVDGRALAAAAASFAAVAAAVSASQAALAAAIAAVSTTTLLTEGGVRVHEYWVRQRSPAWWEVEAPRLSDEEFREHFRVCRATFLYIVERLRAAVQRNDTRLRKAVPAEVIVAAGLRRLATGDTFQTIAALFGLNRSSAKKFCDRTVCALVELQADFIYLPKSVQEVEALAAGSLRRSSNCGGWPGAPLIVDGTHIGVAYGQRRYGHSDMRNRHGDMSHNVMLVCDYETRVRAVVAGRHGSTGDPRIWRESAVGQAAMNGTLFFGAAFSLPSGERIAYHMLGDGIYPACQLMHKAPSDVGGGDDVAWHAYCHSVPRQAVEHLNAKLKGRWRTLKEVADYDVDFVPYVVVACCVLHNICLDHAEEFDERLAPPERTLEEAEEEAAAAAAAYAADDDGVGEDETPVDALSIRNAVLAMRKHMWTLCPPDIRRKGVRAWREEIRKA